MNHYQTHKQTDPEMTLGKFIRLHYLQCDSLATDNQEHKQLPFRTTDPGNQVVSLAPPHSFAIPEKNITHYSEHIPPNYHEQYVPNPVLLNIFRPPRV